MKDEIAEDMILINRITLLRDLAQVGVRLYTKTSVTAVDATGVVVTDESGTVSHIDADTIVTAFGVGPNTGLGEMLTARGIPFESVGDCVQPAKVGEAINAGYLAALAL